MTTQPTTTTSQDARAEVVSINQEQRVGESLFKLAMRRLRRDYLTLGAFAVLFTLAILSYSAPIITNIIDVDYRATDADDRKLFGIGEQGHILGTDHLGRDLFARLLYAGQISIGIGVISGVSSIILGVAIGLTAGYYQGGPFGVIDDIIMWFITTLNAIPSLMLLILLAAVLTPSVSTLIFSLTLISWTTTMRLVRGETLSHRSRDYVLSAEAIGARPLRIMYVQILPNVFSVFIVALALQVGTLILVEAALSFLGLGVRPPTPSWGNMLTEAQRYFRQGPHLSILPGLMIVATVLSLYLIGDGLRDAFDPQASKRK